METFGERLKALRLEKGLSTYRVEEETGLNNTHLLRIEKGARPANPKVLNILSGIYGVEYERLVVWKLLSQLSEKEIEILKEELSSAKYRR